MKNKQITIGAFGLFSCLMFLLGDFNDPSGVSWAPFIFIAFFSVVLLIAGFFED